MTVKAQFKDESGYYDLTLTYNPELWSVAELIAHEMDKSNSKLIQIYFNEKLN